MTGVECRAKLVEGQEVAVDATTPDDFEEEAALPLPEPVGISAVVGDPGKVRPAAGRS